MAVNPIPEGYHSVTPYLVVEEVDGLIDFLKQAFGAEEKSRHMRPDGSVMHAEVRIGDSVVMIGGAPSGREQGSATHHPRRPASLHLYVEEVDAVYARTLAADAVSLEEPTDKFYGDRNAGVTDPFGNVWWIATHVEDVSPKEFEKRQKARAQEQENP